MQRSGIRGPVIRGQAIRGQAIRGPVIRGQATGCILGHETIEVSFSRIPLRCIQATVVWEYQEVINRRLLTMFGDCLVTNWYPKQKRPTSCIKTLTLLISGSPGRARTADLVINSHPLYRLSYRGSGRGRILLIWTSLVNHSAAFYGSRPTRSIRAKQVRID